ncbi:glycine betaine ABC transporter substrate-binding protein [Chloroflexota bacterium]
MFNLKSKWKACLFLFTILVMMVTLVVGCAEEEKPNIIFADCQWESQWINNAIAKFVIEEGYGYPVETIICTTAVWQTSLPLGDMHVDMEMWQQNTPDWYNEQIAAGGIENLGMTYEGGPQFWIIPEWVHEEYGIDTVDDMKDHWELFEDVEDPSKGLFVNSLIGWQCTEINKVKMEAYGLTEYYNILDTGSSGALDAGLAGPQMKHEPVFGYYWAPTAIMGMYDWYILEEPEYDADVWADIVAALEDENLRPLDEACAYEDLPIDKGIWPGLRDMAPDVVEMLEEMVVGLEALNRTAAWSVENEVQDYEKAAVWYLREYEERWETWVTDDAYDKIKDALDEYGDIP